MPNCAKSFGRPSPVLSSTAQGKGAPRATAMRSRSSTPMSSRSPTKRSPASTRNNASASHRLARSMRSLASRCQARRFPPAAPLAVSVMIPSRNKSWPISSRTELACGRRVEIDATRPGRSRCNKRCVGRLRPRTFGSAVAHLAQALDQPNTQCTQRLEILVIRLVQLEAQRRGVVLRVIEGKSQYCVAAFVAQEVRPLFRVSVLRPDNEYSSACDRSVLDLLPEPVEFILTPI